MDYNLLNRLIRSCGENKFLNPSALPALQSFIHASMDNFDHIQNCKSGKGNSYNTLVITNF